MDLSEMPFLEVISKWSSALMARWKEDPGFDYVDHKLHPAGYQPKTPEEILYWRELTHPRRHQELLAYPSSCPNGIISKYVLVIYNVLLKESYRRLEESTEAATGTAT